MRIYTLEPRKVGSLVTPLWIRTLRQVFHLPLRYVCLKLFSHPPNFAPPRWLIYRQQTLFAA